MRTRPDSDWNGDRIAWALTDEQYRQYLMRLHGYHSKLMAFYGDRAERYGRLARAWVVAWVVLTVAAVTLAVLT